MAANEFGEPDVPLRYERIVYFCGHYYWVLFAPHAEVFVQTLDQYVLWRGVYARIGESVMDWFQHKVHEGVTH